MTISFLSITSVSEFVAPRETPLFFVPPPPCSIFDDPADGDAAGVDPEDFRARWWRAPDAGHGRFPTSRPS